MTGTGIPTTLILASGLLLAACTHDAASPGSSALVPSADAGPAEDSDDDSDNDPHQPIVARVNLNVVLRGEGHGHIAFRQPQDAFYIAFLDTKVRGLAPNTDYQLQRATDPVVDDDCTSQGWLTLGNLSTPLVIHTDRHGKGEALFSRDLSGAVGGQFDIHFQVIDAVTKAVLLRSGCYQFKVSQ